MLVFFSKEGQGLISEDKVDAIDVITTKYVIKIRKSGVNIAEVKQSAAEERDLVSIYDETLDLT